MSSSKLKVEIEESWEFKVNCICRQPFIEKSFYGSCKKFKWIQCSNSECDQWFHSSCALMREDDCDSITHDDWKCLVCESKRCIFTSFIFKEIFYFEVSDNLVRLFFSLNSIRRFI